MIELYIALGKEDNIPCIEFKSTSDLMDYIEELKQFNCVWLCSGKNPNTEIVITEDIDIILSAVSVDFWMVSLAKNCELHIHEYPSYEDAYRVALDMREGNNRCYNAQVQDK